MIAPLRINDNETSTSLTEPRHIGELLPHVLAQRGIDVTSGRQPDRRDRSASERHDTLNVVVAETKF